MSKSLFKTDVISAIAVVGYKYYHKIMKCYKEVLNRPWNLPRVREGNADCYCLVKCFK